MRVTQEELASALNRVRLVVREPGGLSDLALGPGTSLQLGAQVTEARGGVKYPDETAEWLLEWIQGHRAAEGDPPAPADPELAAIAAIIPALDHAVSGKWAHGDTSAPAWRVLNYLAARYGYILCTED